MIAVLLSLVLSLASQTSADKGEIRGRVTDKESGRPLARVTVRLFGNDNKIALVTSTDERGVFQFAGLAPGQYAGIVMAGQFRATHAMQTLSSGPGPAGTLVLSKDQVLEVAVALSRAYAINVRVVDPWGEPLSDLRVTVRSADSGRPVALSWQRTTDDQGRLRIFGLSPGRYIVCADADPLGSSDVQSAASRRERLLRTCYPSSGDDAQAEPVRLERSDVDGVEIRMRRGRTFTISGRILDASGAPASGASIGLTQFETNGSSSRGVNLLDADGRFRVANVHPGVYAIEASLGGSDRPEQRRAFEAGFLQVRVDNDDVEDLLVSMRKGVDVPGRVTLEDPTVPLPPAPGSGLMISTRLADDRVPGGGSSRTALMRPDRTFTLTGTFGRRRFEFANVPRGWYVKSIRYGARDIIDEPAEFKDSGDPPALEIVLSNRGAVVTGSVVDDRGAPVARATVLMFRAAVGPSGVTLSASALASTTGTFRLGPAREGDYLLVALPASSPPLQAGEWDRVARLSALADQITLADLDQRTVQLRVVAER